MKKLSILLLSIFVLSNTSNVAHADWRDDFRGVFEGTTLQETDEKLKSKVSEIQNSEIIENSKKRAKDAFSKTKEWTSYKWNQYGKHTYPAEGFEFFADSAMTQKIETPIYFTVQIGAIRNRLYFSDADGNRLKNSSLYWRDVASVSKYKFQQIAANGKVRTNFVEDSYAQQFPNAYYYVWAELELESDEKILRPVPVLKETFKELKDAPAGTEFQPHLPR